MGFSCLTRGRSDDHICGVLSAKGGVRPPPGLPSELVGGPVAQRRMWPPGVEKLPVAIQDHLGVPGRVEHLLVQALLPQPRVKTLGEPVLPGFSRLNKPGADVLNGQPDPRSRAMNSGPLSLRINPGAPRWAMTSCRTSFTSMDVKDSATRSARD